MTLPATVKLKLPKNAIGVFLTLAFVSFGISGRAVQSRSLAKDTYLYGETAQPNEIGQDYVLFTRQNEKVVGAFYSPHSQFECFTGSLNNNTLNVKSVITGDSQAIELKTKLSDFHRIRTISFNDQRILSVCKKVTVALANS